jgi:hypothetical protein
MTAMAAASQEANRVVVNAASAAAGDDEPLPQPVTSVRVQNALAVLRSCVVAAAAPHLWVDACLLCRPVLAVRLGVAQRGPALGGHSVQLSTVPAATAQSSTVNAPWRILGPVTRQLTDVVTLVNTAQHRTCSDNTA